MNKDSQPKTQHLNFQNNGAPYSLQFDDIYFDTNEGYQQSQVVFLDGNQINNRLVASKELFTIGETGFGTGLNFLLTVKAYFAITAKSFFVIDNINTVFIRREISINKS